MYFIIGHFSPYTARDQSYVDKTVIVLQVNADLKNVECEDIVKAIKDTMLRKNGSIAVPEFVVSEVIMDLSHLLLIGLRNDCCTELCACHVDYSFQRPCSFIAYHHNYLCLDQSKETGIIVREQYNTR